VGGEVTAKRARRGKSALRLQNVAVAGIRPEQGLGRKRDRRGHLELCRSIEQFGVLTPITVRPAPDESGDFLLIKGQGRTLACRLLGIEKIPAIVVDEQTAETEKVQQFLVENVARLRLAAVDRALLIARARKQGEETATVAKRFGVQPATVRRLEAQLDGASSGEMAALRSGQVNLALHAVITKHVVPDERPAVISLIIPHSFRAKEMDVLLSALGWRELTKLGDSHADKRLQLLEWALETLAALPKGELRDRMRQLAEQLPLELPDVMPRVAGQ
jgi:ParB/RepB/Spo0J family partition protein